MTAKLYCSYFDHRYLTKGLAMIRSLRWHAANAEVWVLCLSREAENILSAMQEPGIHLLTLDQIEVGDTKLAAAKADGRNMVEYYFTLTPSLVRYVQKLAPADAIVTYLDGDLWFTADPQPIYDEMRDASVLIIPHGFAPRMRHLEKFGRYNVGWVSFRNDVQGQACALWWRERANEWCFDRLDNGRFADQGYLDQFPTLFTGTHVLTHRGANVAPWNVGAAPLTQKGERIYAGGDAVLFFHFHGLKRLSRTEYLTAHGLYKAPLSTLARDALYKPYLKNLLAIEREIEVRFGKSEVNPIRDLYGRQYSAVARLKSTVKVLLNRWRGYTVSLR